MSIEVSSALKQRGTILPLNPIGTQSHDISPGVNSGERMQEAPSIRQSQLILSLSASLMTR